MAALKAKTATCIWCKEGGIKRRYPISKMSLVEDETLGTGHLCSGCYESAMQDHQAQAEYDRDMAEAEAAAEYDERARGEQHG
jgi:hypothetical protein